MNNVIILINIEHDFQLQVTAEEKCIRILWEALRIDLF